MRTGHFQRRGHQRNAPDTRMNRKTRFAAPVTARPCLGRRLRAPASGAGRCLGERSRPRRQRARRSPRPDVGVEERWLPRPAVVFTGAAGSFTRTSAALSPSAARARSASVSMSSRGASRGGTANARRSARHDLPLVGEQHSRRGHGKNDEPNGNGCGQVRPEHDAAERHHGPAFTGRAWCSGCIGPSVACVRLIPVAPPTRPMPTGFAAGARREDLSVVGRWRCVIIPGRKEVLRIVGHL